MYVLGIRTRIHPKQEKDHRNTAVSLGVRSLV